MFPLFIAGFFGGVIRGIVGIIKHQQSYREVPIRPWYLLTMLGLSGAIGIVTAWVTADVTTTFVEGITLTPALALIAGYAGGDLIENLFKIIIKKPDLFA